MKKTLLILAAALSGALAASAQTGREWQDPAVNEINRLPMHSTFAAGESMPLDGVWKFRFAEDVSRSPADFWRPGADLTGRWITTMRRGARCPCRGCGS